MALEQVKGLAQGQDPVVLQVVVALVITVRAQAVDPPVAQALGRELAPALAQEVLVITEQVLVVVRILHLVLVQIVVLALGRVPALAHPAIMEADQGQEAARALAAERVVAREAYAIMAAEAVRALAPGQEAVLVQVLVQVLRVLAMDPVCATMVPVRDVMAGARVPVQLEPAREAQLARVAQDEAAGEMVPAQRVLTEVDQAQVAAPEFLQAAARRLVRLRDLRLLALLQVPATADGGMGPVVMDGQEDQVRARRLQAVPVLALAVA